MDIKNCPPLYNCHPILQWNRRSTINSGGYQKAINKVHTENFKLILKISRPFVKQHPYNSEMPQTMHAINHTPDFLHGNLYALDNSTLFVTTETHAIIQTLLYSFTFSFQIKSIKCKKKIQAYQTVKLCFIRIANTFRQWGKREGLF